MAKEIGALRGIEEIVWSGMMKSNLCFVWDFVNAVDVDGSEVFGGKLRPKDWSPTTIEMNDETL